MTMICANCGIAINWQPTVVDGRLYCCPGCASGGPCTCDYSRLPRLGEFRAVVCQLRVIHLPQHEDDDRRQGDEPGDRGQ